MIAAERGRHQRLCHEMTRRNFLAGCAGGLVGSGTRLAAEPQRLIENQRGGMTPRRFCFVQLDVFTTEPLQGNPLAVFTDARGLSDVEMQALAREMNLSETTFIFPRAPEVERERGVHVRIFTTEEELPFAGHPTLGTAMVLRARKRETSGSAGTEAAREISLDLRVGKIPVVFREESNGKVFGEMRQRDPEFGPILSPEDVAPLGGLDAGDIVSGLPIQTISTGIPSAIVPVKSLRAIRNLSVDWRTVREFSARHGEAFSFYWVTREAEDPAARLHARMIFSNGEDAATGSAAGCAAAWMVRYGVAQPEEQVLIEQGIEIHRPSRIFVRAGRDDEQVANVRVGGHAVEVLRGKVFF